MTQPNIGDREAFHSLVEDMLDRRWFTNGGPYVEELERRIAHRLGVRHCVAVSSGTSGLMLAARAVGLTGEVILPSFTFIGTAHALSWMGLRPVFCDIDRDTWTIDPAACEALVTPATTAILGVHLFGRTCDVEGLGSVARRHDLRLLFDAAHAFGCTHQGQQVGNLGDLEVFSFHATKAFHTFEGGAVVTDIDEVASRVRELRNFGFQDVDRTSTVGINAKMPEVCAAMGLANFDRFEDLVAANRATHDAYASGLSDVPGLDLRTHEPGERHNWQYVVLEVDEAQLGLDRDSVMRLLHAENVLARRYFHPGCHRMQPYLSQSVPLHSELPVTEDALSVVLLLPGGQGVSDDQALQVCELLRTAARRVDEVRPALQVRGVGNGN